MTTNRALRVLIIDDSALYRKIVRDVLAAVPGVEVVGAAANGAIGLSQIQSLRPDVVTLDFEMPQLDGIGVLRRLAGDPQAPAAIMISAFTATGAEATTTALQEGAFDFILKPSTTSLEQSVQQLRRDLVPKLQACQARTAGRPARPAGPPPRVRPPRPASAGKQALRQRPDILGIAVSTGGPKALTRVLPKLPADLPCPVVIVQHMPPMFTSSLAMDLDKRCPLHVVEGSHGARLVKGQVVIAPGGKHMRVAADAAGPLIEITNDPPERNCKPAADYLFRSIASTFGAKSLGLVLTGMGDDGTLGAQAIKESGGVIIAQDEASCVVYGMPKSVVDAGLADAVVPLENIATKVSHFAQRGALV